MTLFLSLLHVFIVITFTSRILLRRDLAPQARLAWFVVLLLLPIFGSLIYALFGEIDLRNKTNEHHARIFARIRQKAGVTMGSPANLDQIISPHYRSIFRYSASINGFYPTAGNTATLMADATASRKSIVADIDAATAHVHVLYYIWLTDSTGTDIANALIRAAKRGVTCRAMADRLGSRRMVKSALWQEMKAAGVQLAVALPFNALLHTIFYSRIDLRNHRKITVIDGRITYCGSQNAADPAFRLKPKYAPWVDIMLRFEGPVVAQNQILFASDWMQATGELIAGLAHCPVAKKDGFSAQVMGDGPTERRGATPQLFSSIFATAQARITLTTPYFVPDATVLESLCAAAFRGVEVTLVFPANNDSWFVAAASRSYYHKLLEAGCVIYEYKKGLLHAKTLTVDGRISLIGSSNLDLRSFDLNYENNIMLQDIETTKAIYARQNSYISDSKPIGLPEVMAWSRPKRIWHNAVATIGPIL